MDALGVSAVPTRPKVKRKKAAPINTQPKAGNAGNTSPPRATSPPNAGSPTSPKMMPSVIILFFRLWGDCRVKMVYDIEIVC